MVPVDIAGQKFGRLTAISLNKDRSALKRRSYYNCVCDCGNVRVVDANSLRLGKSKSCGCLKNELSSIRSKDTAAKHRMSNTRLYRCWIDMRRRCNKVDYENYAGYGGRGITVCEEWDKDFVPFYEWAMSNGYQDNFTLDRINNEKGYSPDNCRWASRVVQQNNRRNTVFITIGDTSHTVTDWAKISGLRRETIYHRYFLGVRGEELLKPVPTR